MAVTTNAGIKYPGGGEKVNPIQGHLAALANSADDAFVALANSVPGALVGSNAERDAKYPTPVQGNAVYRTDIGGIQRYYGLYNVTTNPQGASAAGWYMESGTVTSAYRSSGNQLNVNNGAAPINYDAAIENPTIPDFSYSSGVFTARRSGRYLVVCNLVMEGAGAVVGYEQSLLKNGTSVARAATQTSTTADTSLHLTYSVRLAVGDKIQNNIFAAINPPGIGAVEGSNTTYIQITRVGSY